MPLQGAPVPFDAALLDELMAANGVDLLIASSKHNIR